VLLFGYSCSSAFGFSYVFFFLISCVLVALVIGMEALFSPIHS
jgi:hypothetical protein